MTADEAISALDDQIALHGEDVVLRRLVPGAPPVEATVRAHVRGYLPRELVGSIVQGDTRVVLSPTSISAAGWPGAATQIDGTDAAVPRKGDRVVLSGRVRAVEAAAPVYLAGALVRIELQVRG
jgi:hypothetical protein